MTDSDDFTDRLVPTPDGTAINVRTIAGSGDPVVFLHGFTGHVDTMMAVATGARSGRPAVLIDLVGHGASESPAVIEPYTMSSVVDQVLVAMGPHEPRTAHLVGYSMGGRVVLSIAARAPWHFASITTVSASPGIADPREREERRRNDWALAERLQREGLEAFVDHWLSLPLFEPLVSKLDDAGLAATRDQRLANDSAGLIGSLKGTGAGSMSPVWNALPGLRTPMLAIAGSLDQKYVEIAERMAADAWDCRAMVVKGCGHALPLENPVAVATHIAQFLEGCETSPPS